MSRIAIVIGVNKPRTLAPLQGAASDARAFAKWIETQGFETKPFIDDTAPVAFTDVFNEIARVVEAQTYSQAVIYFAGHGFQNGGSEVWLLSGAPINPAEAISVEASVMAARESGLVSVVFISDACRSIPSGLQNSRVDGNSIFPNAPLNRRTRPEIDRLFATLPSLVAVEAASADDKARRDGIFTREFMQSYIDPPDGFVEHLQEDGKAIEVVTNRKLKDLVRDLVEDAAFQQAPKSGQLPEFILESVEAYVGRVARADRGLMKFELPSGEIKAITKSIGPRIGGPSKRAARRPALPPRRARDVVPTVAALAQNAIKAAREQGSSAAAAAAAKGIDPSLGFQQAIDLFSASPPIEKFETQTGFSVTGAGVADAACANFQADVEAGQSVRLWPADVQAPCASVLIEFDNGNGVVLPGLRGYIGHVFVEQDVVINVNYVPARNSRRWNDYEPNRGRLDALRATIAAAAQLGVFRIEADKAKSIGDDIRVLKSIDPTLGLYAAYAYASAGLEGDVASVLEFMHGDLATELLDIAMLARRGVIPQEISGQIVPFCPVLRQGWALLDVRGVQLAAAAREARNHLLPALWTTFAPDGVALLKTAIKAGDFR